MNKTYRILPFFIAFLVLLVTTAPAWAGEAQFAIKDSHKDSNGVTLKTAAGSMRIEACGDRIIHVVASPTGEIPAPKVPVVLQPCRADHVVVKIGKRTSLFRPRGLRCR